MITINNRRPQTRDIRFDEIPEDQTFEAASVIDDYEPQIYLKSEGVLVRLGPTINYVFGLPGHDPIPQDFTNYRPVSLEIKVIYK